MAATDHQKRGDAQTAGQPRPPDIVVPVMWAMHQAVAMDGSAADASRHRHQAGFNWYGLAVVAVAALLIVYVALGP